MGRSVRDFPIHTIGHIAPALEALSSLNLFVVSGAGLPIPIIPSMDTIIRLGISGYDEIGSYPARLAPRTELRDRLLPNRTPSTAAWNGGRRSCWPEFTMRRLRPFSSVTSIVAFSGSRQLITESSILFHHLQSFLTSTLTTS